MDSVSSVTEGSKGQANVALLNDLDYDHVTIGNNEGITLPFKDVYTLYDKANFNVICSNLNCTVDDDPEWLKKSFRSEEHTSELQSRGHLVCRLLLEKQNN